MRLVLSVTLLIFSFVGAMSAQQKCMTDAESKKVIDSVGRNERPSDAKKIKKELESLRDERLRIDEKITGDMKKNADLIERSNALGQTGIIRVCEILKTNGWLTKEDLGEDGFDALLYHINNTGNAVALRELLPLLIAASEKKQLPRPFLASVVDTIRVGFRQPQLFGTKAKIVDNVVYVYPLLNDEKVDEWRGEYGLTPISQQIRGWERSYQMPVVRSPRRSAPTLNSKQSKSLSVDKDATSLGLENDEDTPLVVETNNVNLNVRLITPELKDFTGNLTRDDFVVTENGEVQEATYFTDIDKPFDLVLLLDFSGSTTDKQSLIKKAARKFVEKVRPIDRVAIVAFANQISLMSDFTSNKQALSDRIEKIDETGSSPIWDSLRYVYETLLAKPEPGRRTAIIFMTDAVDNSRKTIFSDAVELARRGDTTIFPVMIWAGDRSNEFGKRLYRQSETALWMLAEESGGQLYKANKLEDLEGLYEQVANAVGRVYSLSYEPKNGVRDGAWREIKVTVKGHPELTVRTRRGYYAN